MTKNILIIALALAIIGAINWGLVGLFAFDPIVTLFGVASPITQAIHILIGAAGLYLALIANKIFTLF